ncbi:MAG: hypothetical protein JRH20_04430 [Deltaproteobacteria bacterium]|nr:hypothetical protein [Deltaproteobacteria bacterium]
MNLVASRISLVLTLCVAASFELLLNRVGVHVASASSRTTALYLAVDRAGLFFFYFTGLLAFIVFAWGLVVLISDGKILPLAGRLAAMLAGAAFLPLAATGLVFRLPPSLAPWLNVSFGLMVLVLVVTFGTRPAALRHKLGVFYLAAPLLLHCYWLVARQLSGIAPEGLNADLPSRLLEVGQHLVVVGAFASFLFFIPFPRLSALLEPIPLAIASLLTGAMGFLVAFHHSIAARASFVGLSITLPQPTAEGFFSLALHLAALFFLSLTVTSLLIRGRAERAMGFGLLMVAVSGFHLELPYQLLLTLAGMMQLMRGVMLAQQAEAEPRGAADGGTHEPTTLPKAEVWQRFMERVAEGCGVEEAEAVNLLRGEHQVLRLRGRLSGMALGIRVQLQRGCVRQLEVDLGQPPKEEPAVTLLRREGRRGDRVADGRGSRVRGFDSRFVLRDATGELSDVLTPHLERLEVSMHGWLGIWPVEGLQYVMRPGVTGWPLPLSELVDDPEHASTEQLISLVALLADIGGDVDIR